MTDAPAGAAFGVQGVSAVDSAVVRRPAPHPHAEQPGQPVRTCVGCRRKAPVTDLLRVVVRPAATQATAPQDANRSQPVKLVPDPARRLPGRGAHVHPDAQCLADAIKRHAFNRALRFSGTADASALSSTISPTAAIVFPTDRQTDQ